jgi:hypothetical protein
MTENGLMSNLIQQHSVGAIAGKVQNGPQRNRVWECGLDSFGCRKEPEAGSC